MLFLRPRAPTSRARLIRKETGMPIDYGRWVSRSWEIFSRYRVLWLLGLIAGIVSGFSGGYSTVVQGVQPNFQTGDTTAGPALGGFFALACVGALVLLVLSFIAAAAEAAL